MVVPVDKDSAPKRISGKFITQPAPCGLFVSHRLSAIYLFLAIVSYKNLTELH